MPQASGQALILNPRTRPEIEPESTVLAAGALSTRPLISFSTNFLPLGPNGNITQLHLNSDFIAFQELYLLVQMKLLYIHSVNLVDFLLLTKRNQTNTPTLGVGFIAEFSDNTIVIKRYQTDKFDILRGRLLGNHYDFHWQLGG